MSVLLPHEVHFKVVLSVSCTLPDKTRQSQGLSLKTSVMQDPLLMLNFEQSNSICYVFSTSSLLEQDHPGKVQLLQCRHGQRHQAFKSMW